MKVGKHLSKEEIESEYEIVKESQRNPKVFGRLYDKHFESIFTFLLRRTESEEIASDVSSNVFYKALTNIKKYKFQGLPFSAWLFRIAINELNIYYSKENKKKMFNIEEYKIRKILNEDSDQFEFLYDKILLVLEDVPIEIVEIIELRFFEELSFKEISYILNISESGAKMRTYRALEKIKTIIDADNTTNEQA